MAFGETQSYAACHGMLAIVPLEILVRFRVVFPELLDYVLAHIRIILLDLPSDLQLVFRWHLCHLSALSHQVEYELCDVSSGDWDVLDSATDDIALRTRNNVSHTVTGIDDRTGQCAVGAAIRGPRRGKGQHSLNSNVQTLDVERLEENLGRLFTILRWVQRGLSLWGV